MCEASRQTPPRQTMEDHSGEDIRPYQPLTLAGRAPRQGRSVCGDPVSGKARTMIIGYAGERPGRRLLRKPSQFRNSARVKHRAWVCLRGGN